jgi:hypothetical protein
MYRDSYTAATSKILKYAPLRFRSGYKYHDIITGLDIRYYLHSGIAARYLLPTEVLEADMITRQISLVSVVRYPDTIEVFDLLPVIVIYKRL